MLKYKSIKSKKNIFHIFLFYLFIFFFLFRSAALVLLPFQRRTCIKNTQILLKNQHAVTARRFLRKVSGIVVVYKSGINLPC